MFKIIKLFFSLLDKSTRKKISKLYIIVIINGLFEIIALMFVYYAFSFNKDEIPVYISEYISTPADNIQSLLIIFSCLIYVLKILLTFFVNTYVYSSSLGIRSSLQKKLFRKLLSNNLNYMNSKPDSYWIQALTLDAYALEGRLITPLFVIVTEFAVILTVSAYLFYLGPLPFFIIVSIFLISGFLIMKINNPKMVEAGMIQQANEKKLVQITNGGISGWREIKIDQTEDYFINHASQYISTVQSSNLLALKLGLVPKAILESLLFLIILFFTALITFVFDYQDNNILPLISVYGLASYRLMPSITKLISHGQSIKHARYPLKTYYEELSND